MKLCKRWKDPKLFFAIHCVCQKRNEEIVLIFYRNRRALKFILSALAPLGSEYLSQPNPEAISVRLSLPELKSFYIRHKSYCGPFLKPNTQHEHLGQQRNVI